LAYDALGQLRVKKYFGTQRSEDSPLETQVFDYNIRGWMLGINRDFVSNVPYGGYSNSGETFTTPPSHPCYITIIIIYIMVIYRGCLGKAFMMSRCVNMILPMMKQID
jgi:hypothetical protein